MKIKFSPILIFLLAAALLVGCHESTPTPDQEPEYPIKAERSVLVYMVANNTLTGFDRSDLNEMQQALDSTSVLSGELLVFHAPKSATPVLVRLRSRQEPDTLVQYTDAAFSCMTEAGMKRVINDSREFVQAPEHGLVLWSHGTGWIQDGITDDSQTVRSFGDDGGKKMNITTLARVLESGFNFDWLYFDCCYMSSVEVSYELRKAVPLIVASSTELPANGMPYDLNVPEFLHPGGSDPLQAAKNTFNDYDAMTGIDRTCTMSVIRTAGMERVASAVKAIYSASDGKPSDGYVQQRFTNVPQSSCHYFDLDHYLESLCLTSDGADRFDGASAALAAFRAALAEAIIYKASTPKLWNYMPLTYHCGLSTYILRSPSSSSFKNYDTLSWYKDVASSLNL